VKATAGDLAQANGSGKIAAANLEVAYVVPGDKSRFDVGRPQMVLETLLAEPPAEVTPPENSEGAGAVLPIVVRVSVPKDAPAGKYAGKLTITGTGFEPVSVELSVEVADWTLPDPVDYRT